MRVATLGGDVITENVDNYELDYWVDARFKNNGTKPVYILNDDYAPGEVFSAGVSDVPVKDSIEIRFDPEDTAPKVTVTYGRVKQGC